jgi:hypothetical protein
MNIRKFDKDLRGDDRPRFCPGRAQGRIDVSDLVVTTQPLAVVSNAASLSLVDSSGDVVSSDDPQDDRQRDRHQHQP